MAETFYYPATTTLSTVGYTGTNQLTSGYMALSANVQVFTSPGTWTKPPQSNIVLIECWGGGGGGGPANGGGGGGGAYVQRWLPSASAPGPQAVTVGAAVAAATNGNPSSVGTLCIAYGGKTGVTGPATAGGAGGAMDSGATQALGTAGAAPGGAGGAATFYGGGGGGGGSATAAGAGGSSVWGGGGGGGGAPLASAASGAGGVSVFGGSGGSAGPPANFGPAAGIFPGGGGAGGGGINPTVGGGASGYVRITSF